MARLLAIFTVARASGAFNQRTGRAILAMVVLLATTGTYARYLEKLRDLERRPGGRAWWLGYARDGVNLAAAGIYFLAYVVAGFGGPAALVLAVATVLTAYGVDWLLGRRFVQPTWRTAGLAAAALTGACFAAAIRSVQPWLSSLLRDLTPNYLR